MEKRGGLNRMFPSWGAKDRLASNPRQMSCRATGEESEGEKPMTEVKVRRMAKTPYKGRDPETNQAVYARGGEVVKVSEAKGAQLLKDFPKDWEKVGK